MATLLTVFGVTVAALGLGMPVLGRLDPQRHLRPAPRHVAALLVGLLIVQFAVWAVGAVRYDRLSMTALLVALFTLSLAGLRKSEIAALRNLGARSAAFAKGHAFDALAAATFAGLVLFHLLGGLAPPADYDGLNYHLSLPKFDLERGVIDPGAKNDFGYFPPLTGMLYRLALAVAGPEAAQVLNGVIAVGVATALFAYAQCKGASPRISLLAAIMYLGLRAIYFQSGTTSVEVALGAYAFLAFVAFERWLEDRSLASGILFGVLVGGAISAKYHGFALALAFAPLLAWALWRGMPLGRIVVGPLAALATILPFLVRNYVETGDPVFPLFGMTEYQDMWGRGYDLPSLLIAPWDIFMHAARYFDGHQLGTPYILAFAPWAFVRGNDRHKHLLALIFAGTYFVQWFFLLSQQVRFLLPVFPLFCLMAAVGAGELWQTVRGSRLATGAVALSAAALFLGQSMFLAGQTLIRVPVVLGLMDPMTYLTKVPTIQGNHYAPCRFISDRLGNEEKYVWNVALASYYCPQVPQTRIDWKRSPREVAEEIDRRHIRFIAIEAVKEFRDNVEGMTFRRPMDLEQVVGPSAAHAMASIEPAFQDEFVRIYDGGRLADALR
jgi:hypothetical protein